MSRDVVVEMRRLAEYYADMEDTADREYAKDLARWADWIEEQRRLVREKEPA
jgi:hypothetical protein